MFVIWLHPFSSVSDRNWVSINLGLGFLDGRTIFLHHPLTKGLPSRPPVFECIHLLRLTQAAVRNRPLNKLTPAMYIH